MNAKSVVLKALLQQRHLQTYTTFCREYDRVAATVDSTLRGGWPSRAQFYRWLSGDLVGLPYADHCRILEGMFPGWKVDQLFQVHDGGIEFVPEPPASQVKTATALPTAPIVQEADQVVAFHQSLGLLASVPHTSQSTYSVVSGLLVTNLIQTEVYNATLTSPNSHPNRIDE